MKKLCFVTAARSEYGLLKWIMRDIRETTGFALQIVAMGAHLLEEQGYTIDDIRADGFVIDEIVDARLDTSTTETIADSMGRMAQGFARALSRLSPDYVVLLGDRYELLPIANTAFVMRVPIIHFSGGDVTESAIDDGIRNAVTMLATYHFPGVMDSAMRIRRMTGTEDNIWAVGEPGLDSFFREPLMSRRELAEALGLEEDKTWLLFTYHAETKKSLDYDLEAVKAAVSILLRMDGIQTVATYSNADFGGRCINAYLEEISGQQNAVFKTVPSLGNRRYLSLMKQVKAVIGNSSSGIVEAPMLGVPVVNIGDRQKGRHLCGNILQSSPDEASLRSSIGRALEMPAFPPDHYWGDGHTAERVLSILEEEICGASA